MKVLYTTIALVFSIGVCSKSPQYPEERQRCGTWNGRLEVSAVGQCLPPSTRWTPFGAVICVVSVTCNQLNCSNTVPILP